jgi:hypothetical protein
MNLQEYRQLQAELGALDKMLDEIPKENVIERIGLEARKAEVEKTLASQPAPAREPVRALLTFRGKPIVGTHGIFAKFGADAVNAFTDAVSAIAASQRQSGPLGARGALPGREDSMMLITGTATGSFGFQLEEAAQEDLTLFPESSPLESAVEQTQSIMQASLGTDDDLTDALSDADPRALDAVRRFLETIEKNEATCALEFKEKTFRFVDVEQVRRSNSRLAQDNIHECDEVIEGQFLGVLPTRRTFEFQRDDSPEIIVGKVSAEVEEPAAINDVLNQKLTAKMRCRRVGEGRPRYILQEYSLREPQSPDPVSELENK